MDQLHLMRIYIAVAEEEGFSAASRRLAMSPPAVTRAIAALEDTLGVKLLNRTTRYVRTTDAGLRYLEDAKRIVQDVETANEAAQGINAEPKGQLNVTAPVLFGQRHVLPGVVEYLKRYPQTEVNAVFVDRTVNLLEEGFDVGIRIGALSDSSMRARKVGEVELILVASPTYLAESGMPLSPSDLNQHTIVNSGSNSFSHDWYFLQGNKKSLHRIKPRLNVTTNQAAINAVKLGLGITRVVSYQVEEELKNGTLELVLPQYQLPPLPVHVIHREGQFSSAKIRTFIDLMAAHLTKTFQAQQS
ncbi:LysR family transcriptional regulator [uncultured Vibrio sp.]|uniref:LysR family transcriptional regulator n=1 Tax=uncultured Vibrio sp. TaxID=114054 RepID=UPI0025ED045E|nr:LysR family transcriptional regulator [uncultured Vibrio sp.]